MRAEQEAVPFIDANLSRYGITWKNTGRTSADWKGRLYEQGTTGRQMGIYDRDTTVVRVEHLLTEIAGVKRRDRCARGTALEAAQSRFKGGKGFCFTVDSLRALGQLLDQYFLSTSTPEEVTRTFEIQLAEARSRSEEDRRKRLASAARKPRQIRVVSTVFARNPDVVVEVLSRAAGHCESCKTNAPFLKASTGEPYLEVHHRIPLADDGDDTVENALALCPNCHRKRHYG